MTLNNYFLYGYNYFSGVSSGSLICGWLMNTYGGVIALRTFSVGALLWLSCFWLIQLFLRKFKTSAVHLGHNRE